MTDAQITAAPDPGSHGSGNTGRVSPFEVVGAGFAGLSAARRAGRRARRCHDRRPARSSPLPAAALRGRHDWSDASQDRRADPRYSSWPGHCARGRSTISMRSSGGPPSIRAGCFWSSARSAGGDAPASGITRTLAAATSEGRVASMKRPAVIRRMRHVRAAQSRA